MEAQLSMLVGEGRSEFMRPLEPPPIANPDDLLPGVAAARHHLVKLRAQRLRIEVRDHVREDFGGAVLERAKHTEQHAARDTAPGARAPPRLPFATLLACELALAEGDAWTDVRVGRCATSPPGGGQSARGSCHLHSATGSHRGAPGTRAPPGRARRKRDQPGGERAAPGGGSSSTRFF